MSRDRDPRIKMSNQDDVVVLSQENIKLQCMSLCGSYKLHVTCICLEETPIYRNDAASEINRGKNVSRPV